MEGIGLRIKSLRDLYFSGNNVKMASELGTSEANVRNYINSGNPKIEFIIAICEKLEINYEWLLTGNGEMKRSGPEEKLVEKEKLSFDGFQNRYISLLEKTVSNLEVKISELNK